LTVFNTIFDNKESLEEAAIIKTLLAECTLAVQEWKPRYFEYLVHQEGMSVREMDENGLLPIEVACKHGPSHVVIGFVRCTMRRPSIFDTHHLSLHPHV
jgi:hypothetical protein